MQAVLLVAVVLLAEQVMEQTEVTHLLHQGLELRLPLQEAVAVEQAMMRMELLEDQAAGVQVDFQVQAEQPLHQDKETVVEMLVAVLFLQEEINLEAREEAEQEQQEVLLQAQIIPQMEQGAMGYPQQSQVQM